MLPFTGTGETQTTCTGTLYDNGGPNANYSDNSNATITIAPTAAASVMLVFNSFDIEPGNTSTCNFDYLEVFDGPSPSSNSLGQFCNNNVIPDTIYSSSSSITLQFHSDGGLSLDGFECDWFCIMPTIPPVSDFSSSDTLSCSGTIGFFDESDPAPTSWYWDFGDGNLSTLSDPAHTYQQNGSYTVTLVAINSIGSDTIIKSNYVNIAKPAAPAAATDSICAPGSATLISSGSGTLNWFDSDNGGTLLDTGNIYSTPVISSPTSYWVEDVIEQSPQFVGPKDDSIGTGAYYNFTRHLIFDVFNYCTLRSVWVDANSGGFRTIEFRNDFGTVLQDTTIYIPAGLSRVTLDFEFSPGSDYQMGVSSTGADLYRNNGGTNYPYTIPGLIEIRTSSAGTNPDQYYYFFYDWEVQEPDCISERTQADVFIHPDPSITVSTDTTICFGDTVELGVSGTGDFLWIQLNSNDPIVEVTPNDTTTYSVTATTVCGVDSAMVTVNVIPLANVLISEDTSICFGETATLMASGIGSFSWQPGGQTTSSITVGPVSTTTYSVTASNSCGSASDSNIVTVLPLPVISINGADTICEGQSTTLTAAGNGRLLWSPTGDTTSSIDVSPIQLTTYYCTVTNSCGAADDSFTVAVDPLPIAGFTTSSLGLAAMFTDTSMYSNGWSWDFGDGAIDNQQNTNHTYGSTGNYTVVQVVENSCGKDTVSMMIKVEEEGPPAGIFGSGPVEFSIFPNPAYHSVMIHFKVLNDITLDIVNILGVVVHTERHPIEMGITQTIIDLKQYPSGVYFVRLKQYGPVPNRANKVSSGSALSLIIRKLIVAY